MKQTDASHGWAVESPLPPLVMPASYNYIAAFLTLDCNLRCSYCINRFGNLRTTERLMTGAEWTRGLNRLVSRPDLPVTLQGGEPTLHPDFSALIAALRPDLGVDVLTNLETDLDRFMRDVRPERLKRNAPYASIRVSFHPESMSIDTLANKVLVLLKAGYSVGIWGVEHPAHDGDIERARRYCAKHGIDFRTKDFLGEFGGELHGRYKYPGACTGRSGNAVLCRTTELLIAPSGHVYRCHGDLYEGRDPIGHILDPAFAIETGFRRCSDYGTCNPCDVKVKTNRFQQYGHTSVEIRTGDGDGSFPD